MGGWGGKAPEQTLRQNKPYDKSLKSKLLNCMFYI